MPSTPLWRNSGQLLELEGSFTSDLDLFAGFAASRFNIVLAYLGALGGSI
jgi:hypothetical protein